MRNNDRTINVEGNSRRNFAIVNNNYHRLNSCQLSSELSILSIGI